MSTLNWLFDLITHIIGMFLETFVDGLLPALFEWYFVTPFAIDFPLIHSLWLYIRLLTAPFLLLGLFVSYYKFSRGEMGKNIVTTFLVALIFSGISLYVSDYAIFIGNQITGAIINPVLVEAYKDEKSGLQVVQEGLSENDIDFSAFSPMSVLKYSFGVALDEDNSNDNNRGLSAKVNGSNQANTYEDNLNKVKASKKYPGVGSYETALPELSYEDLDEKLYEVFLIENGGAGPIVCFIAMIEISLMCVLALLRLVILMLTIGMISIFVTKDTFTGGNEDLIAILTLLIKTIAISFVFNLGWMASSILTRNDELIIIHPQFWAIIVYGIVIVFTYYFWVKQVVNNIIRPSVDRIQNAQTSGKEKTAAAYNRWAPQRVKNFAKKVSGRFGGQSQEAEVTDTSESKVVVQNTSTLTSRQDYLKTLSPYERYQRDPDFFRNSAYDGKHQSTGGNFYSDHYNSSYNEELGRTIKNTR